SRKDIWEILKGIRDAVFGKRINLAITGMEGIGKTVLRDLLVGTALKDDYQKPTRSQKLEKGRVRLGQRILMNVVPGQEAHPRYVALDELFHSKKPIDGVIHVVANGFGLIRE